MTNDSSLTRLGGACSILVGVTYLRLGVLVVFQLPALRQAVLAGSTLHSDALVTIAAGLAGAVLAPIWYIGLGLILRQRPA
jgi:hypothetical protein